MNIAIYKNRFNRSRHVAIPAVATLCRNRAKTPRRLSVCSMDAPREDKNLIEVHSKYRIDE